MDDNHNLTEAELDAILKQASVNIPVPGDGLLARVLADAEAEIAKAAVLATTRAPEARIGIVARVAGLLGGWPAMAGLATAAVAGIWIGYSPPVMLENLADGVMGYGIDYDLEEFLPSADYMFAGDLG